MVVDHQSFDDVYQSCSGWIADISGRLALCSPLSGDRFQLEVRSSKLQELLGAREEGYQKLQQVVFRSLVVLPNTSSLGRDIINQNIRELQHAWEDAGYRMDESKMELESLSSQWKDYEDTTEQLSKWLTDTEADVRRETALETTLSNKEVHLERVKVRTRTTDIVIMCSREHCVTLFSHLRYRCKHGSRLTNVPHIQPCITHVSLTILVFVA